MKQKLVIGLYLLYVLFMGVLCIIYFPSGESFKALVAIGGIVCGAIPLLLMVIFKLQFNLPITICYLLFLIGSQYFGSIIGWYGNGWWDTFMHFISGPLLAFVGIAMYERLVHRDAKKDISPWLVFIFVLSFAVLGGVVWEIYEFTSDELFGMTMQGGGNTDTMTDLVADTLGGLAIAIGALIRTKIKLKKQ